MSKIWGKIIQFTLFNNEQRYKNLRHNYRKDWYIHTVSSIDEIRKPTFLFLHGYWSSNCPFINIFKEMS